MSFVPYSKSLGVVCCYFNPAHDSSRLENYRLFRLNMAKAGVRLLTVELAFGDDLFELSSYKDVLQFRSPDVFWQKERLLQIGIDLLISEGYENVGWFDADIIFEDNSWPSQIIEKLKDSSVCQAFSSVFLKKSKIDPGRYYPGAISHYSNSGSLSHVDSMPGYAWAARAEFFKKCSLLDFDISGAGDSLMFYGFYFGLLGKVPYDDFLFSYRTSSFLDAYNSWAKKTFSFVQGNVSFIPSRIRSLYHGDFDKTYYVSLGNLLSYYDFNPLSDISLNQDNLFVWSSDKRRLHREVYQYFFRRLEN